MLHCAICDQITVTDLGRVTGIVCEIFRYLDISRPLYYVLCRCQNCQYFEYFHADRNSYTLTISTIMQCIGKWMDTTLSHTTSTISVCINVDTWGCSWLLAAGLESLSPHHCHHCPQWCQWCQCRQCGGGWAASWRL